VSDGDLVVREVAEADPPDLRGRNASLTAGVTLFGLAREGRVNRKGLPNPLQLAVTASATMPATYLAGVPVSVQRVLFTVLAGLGRLAGYQPSHARFGEL
jgi:hypothetical protein